MLDEIASPRKESWIRQTDTAEVAGYGLLLVYLCYAVGVTWSLLFIGAYDRYTGWTDWSLRLQWTASVLPGFLIVTAALCAWWKFQSDSAFEASSDERRTAVSRTRYLNFAVFAVAWINFVATVMSFVSQGFSSVHFGGGTFRCCLLYTSDAADE